MLPTQKKSSFQTHCRLASVESFAGFRGVEAGLSDEDVFEVEFFRGQRCLDQTVGGFLPLGDHPRGRLQIGGEI